MKRTRPQPPDLWTALSLFRSRVFNRMQGGLSSLDLDLSMPQTIALSHLAEAEPLTVGALQARMRRSQAAVSHLATQLELRGLIERGSDPDDARRTVLRLSKEGRRRMGQLDRIRKRSFEDVLRAVPLTVRRQLEAALIATLEALESDEAR
jgi:DNA-binding MarR family transcriptional regulator